MLMILGTFFPWQGKSYVTCDSCNINNIGSIAYFTHSFPSPIDGLGIRRVSRLKRTLHLIVISIRHAPTIGSTHHPLSRLEGSTSGQSLSLPSEVGRP